MILFEFEGKKLLTAAGIAVPQSQLVTSAEESISIKFPVVLKAQVLSGKRADVGGILFAENESEYQDQIKKLLGSTINKEKVEQVLVEEKADIEKEYYLSISYDTETRGPLLALSKEGGTGIEERKLEHYVIDPTNVESSFMGWEQIQTIPKELVLKLVKLFFEQDCTLLEINPLVKTKSGEWFALDAKVKLDETAIGRHPEWKEYPSRSVAGYTPTRNEIAAKKIDEDDYRGTAGSTYFDFDGDIAILASGGGASITAMDALKAVGGKPANFTEYSGNPPREKVEKLTKIVLDKPNLHGLWIVGALANFTDIFETLSGIIDALKKIDPAPEYPIVIRRAGPRDDEAFKMLKEVRGFDLHVYGEDTSIPQSAKIITKLAKEYAQKGTT
jgi:succinyl-CoA synthetase beta subunit